MKMPKNVDLSKSINSEKVIEPSIANNEKNIECPPLEIRIRIHISVAYIHDACFGLGHSGTGLIYEMVLVKKLKLEASGHECRKQYS